MADARFSNRADLDLEAIANYTIRRFGIAKADEYRALLTKAAETAANFPFSGRQYTTKSGTIYRRCNAGRHVLFYCPNDDGIFVVRVLHLMMDFDRYLD